MTNVLYPRGLFYLCLIDLCLSLSAVNSMVYLDAHMFAFYVIIDLRPLNTSE